MLTLLKRLAANVATPAANKVTLFVDDQGVPAFKNDQGEVTSLMDHDLPVGGTVGQVPVKVSTDNYDVTWQTLSASDVGAQEASPKLAVLASGTYQPEVNGDDVNFTGSNAIEVSLGVKNTGGGTAVFHYYWKGTGDGFSPSGHLVGGAGARPWTGSGYSDHSTAAYHLIASEPHSPTAQGTDFSIVVTPIGGLQSTRIHNTRFNGDGDIINSKGLTSRKLNALERGRGIEVARSGAAEVSMVGSDPSGFGTLFRGYVYGGGDLNAPQSTTANYGTGYALCGFNGSSWVGAKALIGLKAWNTWTLTDNSTYIDFDTTDVGSTSRNLRLRVMPNGPLHIKNSAGRTENPVDGGYLFVENGALKYKGSSGTVTTIAPA